MKRSSRLYILVFVLLDATLFLAAYLLLGQAQSSHGAPLSDTAPDASTTAAPVALVITPSLPVSLTPLSPVQPSSTATNTSSPTNTAQPSATLTQPATATASLTATHTAQPSATPHAFPTDTLRPTFTSTRLPFVSDLGILAVPTATVAPTTTPIHDLGILPSLTPTATRVIPTRPPVTYVVALDSSPVPPHTPVPTAQPYTSGGPDCIPRGTPVNGILSQRFSRYHTGIDLVVPLDTPVLATQSGQVIFAGWRKDGYGNLVIIQNGQFITYYAHNSRLNVTAGQVVHVGDVITQSGSTGWSSGPHVHYEIRINDNPVDPLTFDPQQYQSC